MLILELLKAEFPFKKSRNFFLYKIKKVFCHNIKSTRRKSMSFCHSQIKMGKSHISINNVFLVLLQNHIDYSRLRIEIYDTIRCIRMPWHWKLILSHRCHYTCRDARRRVRRDPYRDSHVLLPLSAMGINQSISPLARPPLTTSGRSCGRNSDRGAGTSRSISINPLSHRLLSEREEKRGREVISSSFIEKTRVYAPWTMRVSRSRTLSESWFWCEKWPKCSKIAFFSCTRSWKNISTFISASVRLWLAIATDMRKISIYYYN